MARIKKHEFEEKKPKSFKLPLFIERIRKRSEVSYTRRVALKQRLERAGIEQTYSAVNGLVLVLSVLINIVATVFALDHFAVEARSSVAFLFFLLLVIWVVGLAVVTFILWILVYSALDLLIYRRRQQLEAVLPDFLQLTSSNISAGMTIDQALWLAVRPRFGVLAKEVEEVAKRSIAGESLDDALKHFVSKYDSKVLERSVNIMIEGIHAGGEIGDILNKIASNIQENNIMRKEMAANVMTYVIFISFATIVAAPFLFSMAVQLITVIQEVFGRVNLSQGTSSGFAVSISKDVIALDDFQVFAIVSLITTSVFSGMIVSVIKKGDVRGGLKYIPMFIIASLSLFFVLSALFGSMVKGFF